MYKRMIVMLHMQKGKKMLEQRQVTGVKAVTMLTLEGDKMEINIIVG